MPFGVCCGLLRTAEIYYCAPYYRRTVKLYTLYIILYSKYKQYSLSLNEPYRMGAYWYCTAANSVIRESRRPRYGHTVLMNAVIIQRPKRKGKAEAKAKAVN